MSQEIVTIASLTGPTGFYLSDGDWRIKTKSINDVWLLTAWRIG